MQEPLPECLVSCDDLQCKSHSHEIYQLHDIITHACSEAARVAIPVTSMGGKRVSTCVPGWTVEHSLARDRSTFWHRLWISNDKPEHGWIASIMKSTRAQYHYLIRKLKRSRDYQIRGAFGRALLRRCPNNRDYWKEVRKLRDKKSTVSTVVDGFTDCKDIANTFASKYKLLYNSVLSDELEMQAMTQSIACEINSLCVTKEGCTFIHSISVDDVKLAVKKLKSGKSGGSSGIMSDCYVRGTDLLYHYIALLFNRMLVHGVVPEDFRVSILVPIPKGPRVDARNSDNYRAVALSSVLGKILDNIIVCTQEESLATSNQQFGYKANLSTIMCSSLVIETIHYFESKCSPTCVLFIDASKAFDRVRHIDLFNVLSKRNMCALVRRLLMTMYSDQRIQVRWSNVLSEMFHMKNGVKQGAVLSPKLFTVVLDGLFENLLQSGVGCRIDNIFAGAFGYADDIVLLAPSADALKFMISICEAYAYEFSILFNPRKSKLMCFNVNVNNLDITLCGEKVIHCDSETYLGVSLNSNITDRAITQTVCSFYQKSNHVIANYSMLDSFSRCKLHTSFCMSLYGSELWNYNSRYIEEIYVAWRKTMRKLFRLPYRTHNYIVCGITEDISIKLHRRVTKFMYSMIHSDNNTVRLMTTFFLSTEASFLAENFRYIMYTYNIPMFTWYMELSVLLKCLTYPSSLSDIELSNIDTVRELLSIRDEVLICPISHSAAGTLIDDICIS